ncbi:acyl-CoA carboxylase epsilon subunit [Naasia sp. SYSU D00057]|uniref:acyl-CoA carboxylase epsilon subunit n=1 Tax=Naasia sp. SYSU D00057 TaxID=2817380 RepID=UPI001B307332|nr:acyl-CoA carboxylase epsilon subunit [Naasia sp. SYSU D00057]
MSASDTPEAPLDVRVIRGTPTEEELAAVIAVLSAAAAAPRPVAAAPATAPSGWQRSVRSLRGPLHPGMWR